MNDNKYTLATADAETDPFLYGRKPQAFAWGLFDGLNYWEFWGDNATEQFIDHLKTIKTPLRIYAHNGGKFDFFYLLEKQVICDPVKIINGRIVSARIGIHEIRDSYAIIPVPLAAYQKDVIDYNWFERENREQHKADILHYLANDCEYLFDLVHAFVKRFGYRLTIGGTAINTLREFHPFDKQNDKHDEIYRPYYFGGRVQCYDVGEIRGAFKCYDVNSMYPFVMANKHHPTGKRYTLKYNVEPSFYKNGVLHDYPFQPYFIHFTGSNKNALCARADDGSLTFEKEHGEFFTMSHELQTALKYGLVEIDEIHEIRIPFETIRFDDFVNTFITEKIDAKKDGDKTRELFSKLLLNSSYGKFGQNPDNFFDWAFRYRGEQMFDLNEWELYIQADFVELWRKPSPKPVYFDVATAASITSAARAVLLEAIVNADTPLYCDTDSLICKGLNGVRLDPYQLGAWDLEASGDLLCLAGKKLYALFDGEKAVKTASKGVKLSATQIREVANGTELTWRNHAPNFKFDGQAVFTARTVKRAKIN